MRWEQGWKRVEGRRGEREDKVEMRAGRYDGGRTRMQREGRKGNIEMGGMG